MLLLTTNQCPWLSFAVCWNAENLIFPNPSGSQLLFLTEQRRIYGKRWGPSFPRRQRLTHSYEKFFVIVSPSSASFQHQWFANSSKNPNDYKKIVSKNPTEDVLRSARVAFSLWWAAAGFRIDSEEVKVEAWRWSKAIYIHSICSTKSLVMKIDRLQCSESSIASETAQFSS